MRHTSGFRRLYLPLLMSCALLAPPLYPRAQAADSTELVLFRAALDQIAAGKTGNAKLLLESGAQNGPLSPESAALLAYAEEKLGQKEAARSTLQSVAQPTPLTLAYIERLGSTAPSTLPISTPPVVMGGSRARLAATDARLTVLERLVASLINEDRKKQGLKALDYDDNLAEVARAHSAEMRDKNYFAHYSPTPGLQTPSDRHRAAAIGPTPRVLAENVYRAYGDRSFLSEEDARSAHQALMNSPGHRANILDKDVTRVGVGYAADAKGNIWITEMFVKYANS